MKFVRFTNKNRIFLQ